jgi:acetylornithine deacetylase/succinyl-diaminopimelate desuccinylase-like protein
VLPHIAVAHVSCRLVPGQDPDRVIDAIVAHVGALAVPGVRAQVRACIAGTLPATDLFERVLAGIRACFRRG